MASEFDIFKINDEGVVKCEKEPNVIDGCDALKRLRHALKYYSKFDIINNPNDKNIFANFIIDTYKNFLNDYIHLVDNHSKQIQQINEQLEKDGNFNNCNIKTCKFTSRHYRTNNLQNDNNNDNNRDEDDDLLNFYTDTIDSLHFYLLHLFDCGLRVKRDDNDKNEENKDETQFDDNTLIDAAFAGILRAVNARKSTRESFNRFKNTQKFSIQTSNKGKIMSLFRILLRFPEHLFLCMTINSNTIVIIYRCIIQNFIDNKQYI